MEFIPGIQGFFSIFKSISVIYHINKLKSKTIWSSTEKKPFDEVEHLFMIKTIQKVGLQGTCLNIIRAVYNKPTANSILKGEKLKAFPLRSETRQ